MNITCPACRATLQPNEIDRERRECPLCSASLAEVDLSAVEGQLGGEDEAIAGNPLPAESHGHAGEPPVELPVEPPSDPTRQVEIIERTRDRLVVHIPPSASGSGGLGFFAIVWNGGIGVISWLVFSRPLPQPGRVDLFHVLFLALFWMVGIALVISWVRMRFMRFYLLLEKDRLVTQRKLFRTTNTELLLGPAPKAVLEQSYTVNDVPVYSVAVLGEYRKESFGTGLADPDKEFLVRIINDFLGVQSPSLMGSSRDAICSGCGSVIPEQKLTAEVGHGLCPACHQKAEQSGTQALWPPLRANSSEELPAGLQVDESDSDRVQISWPLLPPSRTLRVVSSIMTSLALAWSGGVIGIVSRSVQQAAGVERLSTILMGLGCLAPALILVGVVQALARGRIQIDLNRDLIRMRWGWGPVAIRKQFLPETITGCCLIRGLSSSTSANANGPGHPAISPLPVAAIQAGGTPYPLITFHGIEYGKKVIRVVRTYLEQVTGRKLPD